MAVVASCVHGLLKTVAARHACNNRTLYNRVVQKLASNANIIISINKPVGELASEVANRLL